MTDGLFNRGLTEAEATQQLPMHNQVVAFLKKRCHVQRIAQPSHQVRI